MDWEVNWNPTKIYVFFTNMESVSLDKVQIFGYNLLYILIVGGNFFQNMHNPLLFEEEFYETQKVR